VGHYRSAQDPDGYNNQVMSGRVSSFSHFYSRTCIKSAAGKKFLRRNESIEGLTPYDSDLRNNYYHADEHCEDLDPKLNKVGYGYASHWGLTRAAIIHSKTFAGLEQSGLASPRINKTSAPVIRTPPQSGRAGNRRESAIADPRSSARSVLTMATSESA
jgi:hypothetical protein